MRSDKLWHLSPIGKHRNIFHQQLRQSRDVWYKCPDPLTVSWWQISLSRIIHSTKKGSSDFGLTWYTCIFKGTRVTRSALPLGRKRPQPIDEKARGNFFGRVYLELKESGFYKYRTLPTDRTFSFILSGYKNPVLIQYVQQALLSQPNQILRILYMILEWADCLYTQNTFLWLQHYPDF